MSSATKQPLLVVEALSKTFRRRSGIPRRRAAEVRAVREVYLRLEEGASLAIVGESGSGKTTLARMLVGLEAPSSGRIVVEGREAPARPGRKERRQRGRVLQIVFQDPYTSLDPRQSVRRALDEVQRVHFSRSRAERRARTGQLLHAVGLGEKEARALPRELSGGQRQRAAIARALAAEPKILALDEAVSALDVSIQAQILNLLADLRQEYRLTYIVISHDLAVVRQIADEVIVMYRGRAVESGSVEQILHSPRHPYTQRLIESIPRPKMPLARQTATLAADEVGCLYRSRCPYAHERCLEEPGLLRAENAHLARCWLIEPAQSAQNSAELEAPV